MKTPISCLATNLALMFACGGWIGVNPKPLRQQDSQLSRSESGAYCQLSDNERKELVWMAKAALSAYDAESIPLGYRPFTKWEWNAASQGCDEFVYTGDGYFNVCSGLRGRLLVHITSEQRVILALSGCDVSVRDFAACAEQFFFGTAAQYEQALKLMKGVLSLKARSQLWIVGHSLGGSLTTYLALNIPKSRTQVKCATFNGYGISPAFRTTTELSELAAKRLRNVFCDGDPVYRIPARHFGPEYFVKCQGDPLEQHFMQNLLNIMIENRTNWAGM